MKNIDRRTFQEIVNDICPDDDKKALPMRRILTNISEVDDTEKENNVTDRKDNGSNKEINDENSDEKDKFFLPGNGRQRRIAVNFEDNL